MQNYRLRVVKPNDPVIGTVDDYTSSDDGDKTLIYLTTPDGEKVYVDPYDNALQQNLTFLKIESPSDMIGETFRFGKREHNGKFYFDIKRASPAPAPAPASAPAPAARSSAPVTAPAATAPALSVAEAAAKYDEAIGLLITNTVPKLEMQLQGSLSDAVLAEFLHGAAATILIASTPRQSAYPPKGGGGGRGGYGGGQKPAWKK